MDKSDNGRVGVPAKVEGFLQSTCMTSHTYLQMVAFLLIKTFLCFQSVTTWSQPIAFSKCSLSFLVTHCHNLPICKWKFSIVNQCNLHAAKESKDIVKFFSQPHTRL